LLKEKKINEQKAVNTSKKAKIAKKLAVIPLATSLKLYIFGSEK